MFSLVPPHMTAHVRLVRDPSLSSARVCQWCGWAVLERLLQLWTVHLQGTFQTYTDGKLLLLPISRWRNGIQQQH